MLFFANGEPRKPRGMVDEQLSDPHRNWIDGEVLSTNTFDEYHNYILGEAVFENTDPLIKERGFRILDKMLDQDPNIKNGYWYRIFTILSEEWSIDPRSVGCERSEEIRDFIQWNIDNFMACSMHSFIRKMLDASRQGFKIAELVWKVIDYGKYKGKIGLYDLIVRDSRNYSFLTDKNGRIDPVGVVEGISSTGFYIGDMPKLLPTNKFVIYSYNRLDDDAASIYGNSDFRPLWRPFYGDTTAHRLELRSAETFSRPPTLGLILQENFTKPEQSKIQKDMAGVYNRTYTQIPEGVTVKEMGTDRSDTNAFQSLRDRHSQQIDAGLMIGAAKRISDRSDAQTEAARFLVVLDAIAMDMSNDVVNRQIIRRLVDMNYSTEKYPIFSFPKLSVNRNERMKFLDLAIQRGVAAPDEPWMRKFLNIPKQDITTRNNQIGIKQNDTSSNQVIQLSLNAENKYLIFHNNLKASVYKASDGEIIPISVQDKKKLMAVREIDNGEMQFMSQCDVEPGMEIFAKEMLDNLVKNISTDHRFAYHICEYIGNIDGKGHICKVLGSKTPDSFEPVVVI